MVKIIKLLSSAQNLVKTDALCMVYPVVSAFGKELLTTAVRLSFMSQMIKR